MKKTITLTLIVILALSCKKHTFNKQKEKNTINTLLNNWHSNAANADYDNYFSKMDSDAVFIGTDASENWSKTEFEKFSKPYFDKKKTWHFKPLERNIYFNTTKKIAWFDELLKTHMGISRGSGVLEKTHDVWKIKHYVLSITIPNDNVKEITQINRKKDSIFLQNFKK
ncbi:nuclear transport factor 2 family protein [Tenacibaculum sp. UWU-22]|uniref:nuclear transport factor 2 family protein n=1 Tax=Tenacibaculum sp. UWU-22 TaxID=3234187 RepID=UPI0034DAFD05